MSISRDICRRDHGSVMANYKDFVFFVLSEHLLLISGEQKFRYGGQFAFELPDRGAFDSDGSDKQKCSKLPTKQHVHVKTSHMGVYFDL